MDNLITDQLLENTFLYCWKKMADKEDAKDLAQEIVVDAMLVLRSGKKVENFYGLYWQLARNKVSDFYRRKRPVKISLDDMENTLLGFDKSIGDFITQEELDNLSVSMNYLDFIHRDILVRFYIKGQTVKQIASELEISTGTVTSRLFDARKKLKENFETMESEKNQTEHKKKNAVDFNISYYGDSWNAYSSITSLIDKQILFLCRNKAKSVRQLSKEMDVAAVFLENNIQKLCRGNVLYEVRRGKYITDFTIFPATALKNTQKKAKEIAEKINLCQRYFEILLGMKEELLSEDFYGNSFNWDYLLPYFIIRSNREFKKTVGADYIREKYAVSKYDRLWRYGFLYGIYNDVPDEKTDSENIIGPGYNYQSFVSPKYGKVEIHNTINTMKVEKNNKKISLDMARYDWLNPGNVDLYRELTENPGRSLSENEEVVVADLISKGVLKKTEKGFEGTIPVINFEIIDKWCKVWYDKFKPLAEEYAEAMYQMEKEILLPYIRKDLIWASMCFYFPMGVNLDSILTQYAIDNNLVDFEEGCNSNCAAIVMLKEQEDKNEK